MMTLETPAARHPQGAAMPWQPLALEGTRIARIDGSASAFSTFAFARRRPRLATLQSPWVAIGAWWRGAPVGLALATVENGRAWLDSVMVAAPVRRRGIGRALLSALAEEARAMGATRIHTQYSGLLGGRAPLEALLASAAWSPPQLIDVILVGLAGAMADGGGAWRPVQRARRELAGLGYSVDRYVSGNPADEAAIGALLESAPELGAPDPRGSTATDPEVSVMLRHRGALIGWIAGEPLTRSVGTGTLVAGTTSIHYTSARIADGYPRTLMLVGYYESFSRQAAIHGPASRAVYRTHPGAAAMYSFTRRRFEPMALHVEERFGSSFALNSSLPPATAPERHEPC